VNRLQPQAVQVSPSRSNESGRSCIPYENYCNQGKLGGVDGKVIRRATMLAMEVMMLLISNTDVIDSYES
jgi:hypothetical protein